MGDKTKRLKRNVGKGVEKREPLCTVAGNVNWCSHLENSMELLQKKTKCPSAGEWIKQPVAHTHTVGYDSAVTKRRISTFAATWMNC